MSRILYITPSLNIGGAERHVAFLASSFQADHIVKVLPMFAGGPLAKTLKAHAVYVEPVCNPYVELLDKVLLKNPYDHFAKRFNQHRDKVKLPNDSRLRIRMREKAIKDIIRAYNPDVLHVHTLHCSDALEWGYDLGINKRVFTHHNILSIRHHRQAINRLSENIAYATDITFVSNFQKEDLVEVLKKPITGPVISPISGFCGKAKTLPARLPGVIKLGTLSNLAPVKGVIYLLEAVNMLCNMGFNIELIVAGDGENRRHLQKAASTVTCSQNIHFTGKLATADEVDKFYREIDVFVLPSLSESFGIVLIEAMSYGLPVIASDLPAIKEIITDQHNGLLFRPADVVDLTQKIKLLWENEALRKQIHLNAIKIYSDRYHINTILSNYSKVYSLPRQNCRFS